MTLLDVVGKILIVLDKDDHMLAFGILLLSDLVVDVLTGIQFMSRNDVYIRSIGHFICDHNRCTNQCMITIGARIGVPSQSVQLCMYGNIHVSILQDWQGLLSMLCTSCPVFPSNHDHNLALQIP